MGVGEVVALGWEQSFRRSCKALPSFPQALLQAANSWRALGGLSPGSDPQVQVRGPPWDHPLSQEGPRTARAAGLRL